MKSLGIFRKLLPYLRPYRKRLLLAGVGVLAFNVLILAQPLVYRYLIDDVVRGKQWHLLLPVVLIYAILPILYRSVSFANVLNVVFVGQRLVTDLRLAMYRLALRFSIRYHGEHSSGALIARLMGDANVVRRLVTGRTVRLDKTLGCPPGSVYLVALGRGRHRVPGTRGTAGRVQRGQRNTRAVDIPHPGFLDGHDHSGDRAVLARRRNHARSRRPVVGLGRRRRLPHLVE